MPWCVDKWSCCEVSKSHHSASTACCPSLPLKRSPRPPPLAPPTTSPRQMRPTPSSCRCWQCPVPRWQRRLCARHVAVASWAAPTLTPPSKPESPRGATPWCACSSCALVSSLWRAVRRCPAPMDRWASPWAWTTMPKVTAVTAVTAMAAMMARRPPPKRLRRTRGRGCLPPLVIHAAGTTDWLRAVPRPVTRRLVPWGEPRCRMRRCFRASWMLRWGCCGCSQPSRRHCSRRTDAPTRWTAVTRRCVLRLRWMRRRIRCSWEAAVGVVTVAWLHQRASPTPSSAP